MSQCTFVVADERQSKECWIKVQTRCVPLSPRPRPPRFPPKRRCSSKSHRKQVQARWTARVEVGQPGWQGGLQEGRLLCPRGSVHILLIELATEPVCLRNEKQGRGESEKMLVLRWEKGTRKESNSVFGFGFVEVCGTSVQQRRRGDRTAQTRERARERSVSSAPRYVFPRPLLAVTREYVCLGGEGEG